MDGLMEKKEEKEEGTITPPCPRRSHLCPAFQIFCLPVLGRLPPLQRHRHPVRGRAHALPLQHAQGEARNSPPGGGGRDATGRVLRWFLPS